MTTAEYLKRFPVSYIFSSSILEVIFMSKPDGEILEKDYERLYNVTQLYDEIKEYMLKSHGVYIKITSGHRGHIYNKLISGAKNSLHTRCMAIDFANEIKVFDKNFLDIFNEICFQSILKKHNAYFYIGKNFIHIQVSEGQIGVPKFPIGRMFFRDLKQSRYYNKIML